jgi:hypothetical protein
MGRDRCKLDFSLQLVPQDNEQGTLKVGGVLVIRETHAPDGFECCSTSGAVVGQVPASVHARLRDRGMLQASIRSLKRDASGSASLAILRVEFDGAGVAVMQGVLR